MVQPSRVEKLSLSVDVVGEELAFELKERYKKLQSLKLQTSGDYTSDSLVYYTVLI